MDKNKILEKVAAIIRQVLEDDFLEITMGTRVEDFEDWNSLSNSLIIAMIEEQFSIKFKLREVAMMDSIETFVEKIEGKIKQ